MSRICPYARGFDPHSLDCDLARDAEAKLPWYRRLWHAIRGDYNCDQWNGELPCGRYDGRTEVQP